MLNRLSLRLRITLLSALTLTLVCIALTVLLVQNGRQIYGVSYGQLADTLSVAAEGAQPGDIVTYPISPLVPAVPANVPRIATQRAYDAASSVYSNQSYILMIAIVLAGTALAWFITGRALRPVVSLSRRMEEIDENNLDETLPEPESRDEVAALTRSFNHMLAKVNTAYTAQKRFAQNAAHELKTPVAAILTNIEVAEIGGNADADELRATLETVKESAQRMAALVRDMLSLGADIARERYESIRFSDLLEEITGELAAVTAGRGMRIEREGDVTLCGDRALLRHAFTNILHNSLRYSEPGGPIAVRCDAQGVTIADSGQGIPEESLPFVFEPFYCVDVSHSRALGGSGLGLSIAKQIFDRHGMRIEIQSGEGGTQVRVRTAQES